MIKERLVIIQFFAAAIFSITALAQPLPKIQLKPTFPELKIERTMWMSEAPDGSGRMFIVAQAGKILIVKKGSTGADARVFLDIENRHPYFGNEDGLMSIAFHPGFKTNGLFYVYYNQENDQAKNTRPLNFPYRSVVSEFKVSAADPDKADLASERILLEVPQPFPNHKGGEVAFGHDGYLYLALGDGGAADDPYGNGQSTSTLLAKMLRIDVNSRSMAGEGVNRHELPYGYPADNPFMHEPDYGDRGARKEIFAYGLRNVWRYSFDKQTGDLWGGDVGQDLWEEVDIITNGGNYGWSVKEAFHHFKPGPVGAQYADPVIEYPHRKNLLAESKFPDHGVGFCVIGGYVYRGKKYPSLQGVYVYCDYTLGVIWGLRYDREAKKVTEYGTLLQQPKNITSFAEDADGELYALTQDNGVFSIVVP